MAKKKAQHQQGWSVTTVTICGAFVVAVLAWAVAASAYATDRFYAEVAAADAAGEERPDNQLIRPRVRLRRSSGIVFGIQLLVEFVKNAIVEIPNAPQVITHVLTKRILIPIGFVVVEMLVVGGGLGLKSMEHTMEKSKSVKRKPTVDAIRVPKPTDD